MQISILDLRPQFNSLKDEILKEIAEVCESQRFILGPKVEHFEAMMNDYCHTAATVGVTSGSDALIISLMAEGIGPGDEVIAPTFTFFATAGAIARVGATPVFADIDPVTFNLDPADFERKITPKTKAVIPVHLFGQCADMGKIMAIAKSHNLIVIEDACQSIGAEYNGQRAGSIMREGFSLRRLDALEAYEARLEYVEKYFPQLVEEAALTTWFSCMYQQQMALRYLEPPQQEYAAQRIKKTCMCARNAGLQMRRLPFKQKIWLSLSRIHFAWTCKLRNYLHVGQ